MYPMYNGLSTQDHIIWEQVMLYMYNGLSLSQDITIYNVWLLHVANMT